MATYYTFLYHFLSSEHTAFRHQTVFVFFTRRPAHWADTQNTFHKATFTGKNCWNCPLSILYDIIWCMFIVHIVCVFNTLTATDQDSLTGLGDCKPHNASRPPDFPQQTKMPENMGELRLERAGLNERPTFILPIHLLCYYETWGWSVNCACLSHSSSVLSP